ncbi:MAG: hypothetical protein Q7J08_01195 [Methanocorpusculum sp.]|uniref:hypothetical protein n=1 Tax=Methanocorpusculum sp. TaxID=2058474 RepID=UPI00271FD449|nr:hypothetical protein [Methanocorpusculum sp.]MDO9522311.1 hypothetical protein [Methanocorpusculum sp.]
MSTKNADNYIPELYNRLYKKLKQTIYYTPDLCSQETLARFELNGQEEKKEIILVLMALSGIPSDFEEINTIINGWINKIFCHILPKSVDFDNKESKLPSKRTVSNVSSSPKYVIDGVNYFFDIPVPLLILDVWWITEIGVFLDQELGDCCYANRIHDLVISKKDKDNSSHLFKKYINQYNDWRSNAMKSAKEAVSNHENTLIFSLDFANYFYSIDIDFKKILDSLNNKFNSSNNLEKQTLWEHLNIILEKIHIKSTDLIKEQAKKTHQSIFSEDTWDKGKNGQKKILPIGLPSSQIFANWYLKDFDKKILDDLKPRYYGRYVDDSILVISQPQYSNDEQPKRIINSDLETVIKKYFVDRGILAKYPKTQSNAQGPQYYIKIQGVPKKRIIVQNEKIKIFQIDSHHSTALLKLFTKAIEDNSQVFTYLPEVPINDLCDTDLYHLVYEESGTNKLRNIERLTINQAAFSILLAKQLSHLKICGKPLEYSEEFIKTLLQDLRGKNYLSYIRSWEKLFTLFILSQKPEGLKDIYYDIKKNISYLQYSLDNKFEYRVKKDLIKYEELALASALALLSEDSFDKYCPYSRTVSDEIPTATRIYDFSQCFREANMLRHHHVSYPLLNYVKDYSGDLCNIDVFYSGFTNSLELDEVKIKNTPRFIHIHELQLFYALKDLKTKGRLTSREDSDEIKDSDPVKLLGYLKDAIKKQSDVYQWMAKIDEDKININIEPLHQRNFKITSDVHPTKITITSNADILTKLRVGIVNLKLPYADISSNYETTKEHNLSLEKWLEISQILNTAVKEKCNLVVFPECAIPAQWLPSLTMWTREHQIGLVFGIEHICLPSPEGEDMCKNKPLAYNLTAALLPFEVKDMYKSCCVSLRIKNHYAPEEIRDLNKNGYDIPCFENAIYHLYEWRGTQFTVYNCFELADIQHRAIFRSELDFLIACSWNKDVSYFMDILESVTRDLHCYVVYSNTSEFGCSRIIQPSRHEKRNLGQIGGGKNSTLIVGELDIESLANFQSHEYDANDKRYKPLPPGFKRERAIKRHGIDI